MENIFVEFLPPWVETGLQPAFYDKESGTVLQQTARMYARVNMLIRMFNKLSKQTKTEIENFETTTTETVNEYIEKFNELHDYVHDYFDNLDVQDEINNKLDEMFEDGELQDILISYLQMNVNWCYDTVADMKASDVLIDGCFARTLGYGALNDNGGAIYKIRAKESGETADEKLLIAIGDNLVAELITSNTVNIAQIGGNTDFVTCCNYLIQNGYSVYVPEGNYTANAQITFDKPFTKFECDGNITCNGEFTLFLLTASRIIINLNGRITGYVQNNVRKNVLMQIGDLAHSTSPLYNNIFIKEALDFSKGIYVTPDGGGKGVSYTDIKFTHISADIGIHFKLGQTGANWINENTFSGGTLEPTIYGIYFEKGGDDNWDPYNGNKFNHIAVEPSATCGIKLDWGHFNYFNQMRLSEGLSGAHYIELAEGCRCNTFSNESPMRPDKIYDANTHPADSNHFMMPDLGDSGGFRVGSEFFTQGGTIFVPEGSVRERQRYYGGGYNDTKITLHENLSCNGMTIQIGNDSDDMVYTLPNTFGRFGVTEFILRVTYKAPGKTITLNAPTSDTSSGPGISNSQIDYQSPNDCFLCKFVNADSNLRGKWLVTRLT